MHSILFGVLVAGVFVLKIKAVLFDMGNTLVKYDAGSPEEVFHKDKYFGVRSKDLTASYVENL
jgi:FMN phosphatase YigB (HAD superfamily)